MSKWYVVWNGRKPGIYTTWAECQAQVNGFRGAMFKSFPSFGEAQEAYGVQTSANQKSANQTSANQTSATHTSANQTIANQTIATQGKKTVSSARGIKTNSANSKAIPSQVILPSISVDAACSGNPGVMEYRAVWTETGEVIFHEGPFSLGTNNIGEFLALVQAIQLCIDNGWQMPIYSDSVNAMLWVRGKGANSTLVRNAQTEVLWQRMEQAAIWLRANRVQNQLIKWDTPNWGEIPADFGRK